MNRAERRRAARQVAKGEISLTDTPRSRLMPTSIKLNETGEVFTDLKSYLAAAEDVLQQKSAQKAAEIASEMLYDAEIYMTVLNIMAMLIATEKAIGNLKTVQKSYQKIIDSYNEACDHIDAIGVRKAYEEFRGKYGIELEFDEADMNFIDDDGKTVYERLKIRIMQEKKEG